MDNKPSLPNDKENKPDDKKIGIIVGSAFDFLFEGENNEYDGEYKDYI